MANSTITVTEVGQTTLQAYINTVGGVANVKTEATVPVDQTGTPLGTAANPLRVNPTGTTTQPVSGTVTANQGTANSLANAWPTKLTDGTNSAAMVNQTGGPTNAQYGPVTQTFIWGYDVNTTLHNLSITPIGFLNGIPVGGGYSDGTGVAFPDSTIDKIVVLPAVANASSPPAISENQVGVLSMDLTRNLRTLAKQSGTWTQQIVDPYTGTAARVDSNGNLVVANGTPVAHASQGLTTTPPTYTPFNIYAPPQIPNSPTRQYNGIYR